MIYLQKLKRKYSDYYGELSPFSKLENGLGHKKYIHEKISLCGYWYNGNLVFGIEIACNKILTIGFNRNLKIPNNYTFKWSKEGKFSHLKNKDNKLITIREYENFIYFINDIFKLKLKNI